MNFSKGARLFVVPLSSAEERPMRSGFWNVTLDWAAGTCIGAVLVAVFVDLLERKPINFAALVYAYCVLVVIGSLFEALQRATISGPQEWRVRRVSLFIEGRLKAK